MNFGQFCPSISNDLVNLAASSLFKLTCLTTYNYDKSVLFRKCTPKVSSS